MVSLPDTVLELRFGFKIGKSKSERYAHVVNVGVRKLELANYIASVCCDDAEAYD